MLSLQKLDNDDIGQIQNMIKSGLKEWLDEKLEGKDYMDYFGPIYDTKPKEFTFSCGDIRMIQQISEYVRTTVQKRGYGRFKSCGKSTTQCETDNFESEKEKLQEQLYNGVLELLQPYGKDVTSHFKEDMAIVSIDGGVIKGSVRCILCIIEPHKNKRRKRQDFYSQYRNGKNWVLSNFSNHHLRKVHPIETDASPPEQKNEHFAAKNDSPDTVSILGAN